MSPRPVVGLTGALERARWGTWNVDANIVQRTYTGALARAGAHAVILPPDEATAGAPGEALDLVDGLILTGGSDIDPACYGADHHPATAGTRPERDRFELALARDALDRDLPVLGICRGMQLLNVASGGTLDQDLGASGVHLHTPGEFSDHDVRLEPGSRAAAAVGAELISVRSHHHQGIGALGEGLAVTGRSVPDGLAEAIEFHDRRFALGVLWHTEEDPHETVVAALVAAVGAEAVAS